MWGRCVLEIKFNAIVSPRPWEGVICLSNTNSRDYYQTLGYLPNWPYEQGHEGKFRISGVFAHIPCYQRVDVFAAMNMTAISPDPPQGGLPASIYNNGGNFSPKIWPTSHSSWPHHRHFYKEHADDSPIEVGIFQTRIQRVMV
jgi:hypothetical protein